ncbi:MAG: TIR domain-containing protein [Bacteroidetes bacterium]|nr:TIR domain-containing protein [Bacteroidota bacterium]
MIASQTASPGPYGTETPNNSPSGPGTGARFLRRMQLLRDAPFRFLFGRDVFISYSRREAARYAPNLANAVIEQLPKASFYLDRWLAPPGGRLPRSLKRHARWSSVLVIIGDEHAVKSGSVKEEIEIFSRTGRHVIPIDVAGTLHALDWNTEPWHSIRGAAREDEERTAVTAGTPSEAVVKRVVDSLKFTRQRERLLLAVWGTVALMLVAALSGSVIVLEANAKADVAEGRMHVAEAKEQQANQRAQAADGRAMHADSNAQRSEAGARRSDSNARQSDRKAAAATRRENAANARAAEAGEREKAASAEARKQGLLALSNRLASESIAMMQQSPDSIEKASLLAIESMRYAAQLDTAIESADNAMRNVTSMLAKPIYEVRGVDGDRVLASDISIDGRTTAIATRDSIVILRCDSLARGVVLPTDRNMKISTVRLSDDGLRLTILARSHMRTTISVVNTRNCQRIGRIVSIDHEISDKYSNNWAVDDSGRIVAIFQKESHIITIHSTSDSISPQSIRIPANQVAMSFISMRSSLFLVVVTDSAEILLLDVATHSIYKRIRFRNNTDISYVRFVKHVQDIGTDFILFAVDNRVVSLGLGKADTTSWFDTSPSTSTIITSMAAEKHGNSAIIGTQGGEIVNWWTSRFGAMGTTYRLPGSVRAIALNPSNSLFFAGGDGSIAGVWGLYDKQQYARMAVKSRVICAAFTPDGDTLAVLCSDGALSKYEAPGIEEQLLRSLADKQTTLIGRQGDAVGTLYNPQDSVGAFQILQPAHNLGQVWTMTDSTGVYRDIAIDSTGSYIVLAGQHGLDILQYATPVERTTVRHFTGPPTCALAFGRTRGILFCASDCMLIVVGNWQLSTAIRFDRVLHRFLSPIARIISSSDGSRLAVQCRNGYVYLCAYDGVDQIKVLDSTAISPAASPPMMSPDGSSMVCVDTAGNVCAFDVRNHRLHCTYTYPVVSIAAAFALDPTGRFLALTSEPSGKQITIVSNWNTPRSRVCGQMRVDAPVRQILFSSDSRTIGLVPINGHSLKRWYWRPTDMIADVESRLSRRVTLEERRSW